MKRADLDTVLTHDGREWVVRADGIEARGADWGELDESLRRALAGSGRYPSGSRVRVFMGFDFDTLPRWLRQYHYHYFNRWVEIRV